MKNEILSKQALKMKATFQKRPLLQLRTYAGGEMQYRSSASEMGGRLLRPSLFRLEVLTQAELEAMRTDTPEQLIELAAMRSETPGSIAQVEPAGGSRQEAVHKRRTQSRGS